jgi:TonB family protein
LHILFFAGLYGMGFFLSRHPSTGVGVVTMDLSDFDPGDRGGTSPTTASTDKKYSSANPSPLPDKNRLASVTSKKNPTELNPAYQGEGHGQGTERGDGGGGAGGGVGKGIGSGGGDAVLSQYVRQVLARIEQKKQYPRISQQNGEEGTVLVDLRIGRNGQLLSYEFRKSTPHQRLINATISSIQAASPFPPLPEYYVQESLNLQVPVRYQLH